MSRWNATAKIGQGRQSDARVQTSWAMSRTRFSPPTRLSDRRPEGDLAKDALLPDVAFSHDDNGRAASGSSDQDRCSARRSTWRRVSVTSFVAVVNEFAKKAGKAALSPDERVAVIELEQAGDSAKAAAEADPGASPATRDAVLEAHLVICVAKGKLDL